MTFLEAQNQLMGDLQDDSTESRARAKNWLNLSMKRILARNPRWSFQQKIVQATTLAGVSSFAATTLDANIKGLGACYNRDEDWPITPIHHLDLFSYWPVPADEDSGSPEFVTIKSDGGTDKIFFNKPLAQDAALEWKISLKIADLSADGDTPPWDSEWDYVWLLGAMYYGLKFNDHPVDEVRTELSDFNRELKYMKSRDSSQMLTTGIRFQTPGSTRYLFGKPLYPERWLWIGA